MSEYNPAIKVSNASFSIRNERIFTNISFDVNHGQIVGIVGRNGSGKTMLLRSIIGFAKLDSGYIQVEGKKIGVDLEFASNIGFVIDGQGFLPQYSGFQNLRLLSSLQRKISDHEIREVLTLVGLDPEEKKKYYKYSKGMKQRLAIAQALMGNPKILIFDEPMNGLDQECVHKMYDLFKHLAATKHALIITSHYPGDIENLCDSYYLMKDGILNPCDKIETSASEV